MAILSDRENKLARLDTQRQKIVPYLDLVGSVTPHYARGRETRTPSSGSALPPAQSKVTGATAGASTAARDPAPSAVRMLRF
jgi:hypothetical protein